MKSAETRENILDAADRLFYRQGYENTSFADIADEVRISRGNFYYHFKSKDEILDAVIEARLSDTRDMLRQWEADSDNPADRIRSFIRIVIVNGADIERFGCPVGTLNAELAKLDHGAKDNAVALFGLFRSWLTEQFVALGRTEDADDLAMHVLAFSQGVASLSNAFRDPAFVEREVDRMCRWLDGILAPTG
jgi:TetR/AcrR family transcriptional repressor of nem operon